MKLSEKEYTEIKQRIFSQINGTLNALCLEYAPNIEDATELMKDVINELVATNM